MKLISFFIFALVLSPLAFSQQAMQTDTLKLGRKNTNNKTLTFEINQGAANPKIRANGSTQKIEFTNDGTNFKNLGSGSGSGGGGVNYLADLNFDFEGGIVNWSNTGGTFTATSSTPIEGLQSGLFTASAASQFIQSSLITKTLGAGGRSCSAGFDYNWQGTSGQLTATVLDQSGNTIAGPVNLTPTTSTQTLQSQIPLFDCDGATQFRIRVASTAASAALKIDNAFIGYGRNSQQISQASLVGTVTLAGCAAWTTTSTTYVDPVTTGCAPVYTGVGVGAPSVAQTPGFTISNLAPGTYAIVSSGYSIRNTGGGVNRGAAVKWTDGTNTSGETVAFTSTDVSQKNFPASPTAVFTYSTAQPTIWFRYQLSAITGGTAGIEPVSMQFQIFRYPSSAADAVTLETSGWFAEANITGGNATLGLSQATYTNANDGNLTLTNGPRATTQSFIACDGVAETGSTCSGSNESVGISFVADTAGLYRACVAFASAVTVTNGTGSPVFQIVETPVGLNTILQEGGAKVQSNHTASTSSTGIRGLNVCGNFNFATAGRKVLKLYYESTAAGTTVSSQILADGSGADGQRDIQWTVQKINQQMPTPVFTDLQNSLKARVTSSDIGQVVEYSAMLDNDGTNCLIARQYGGSWISSAVRTGAGACTLNFASGFFNNVDIPSCQVTVNSAVNSSAKASNTTTALIATVTFNGTTPTNSSFNVTCLGRK